MSLHDALVVLYKETGETPLQRVERFRMQNPEYADVPLSYAGRLDPLAEGVLLVLVGEANKRRKEYLSLPKEYEIKVLFGVETDSYDILGLVRRVSMASVDVEKAKGVLLRSKGRFSQAYPPYSSKPVSGKPLFQWAREGKIDEIKVPQKEVEIFGVDILAEETISAEELLERVERAVASVRGDFRQEAVVSSWKNNIQSGDFLVVTARVRAGSGAYMRTLAYEAGKKLGVGAIALHIKRTKVGEYTAGDALR
jgi:tRNA pseudouridine55 synthase